MASTTQLSSGFELPLIGLGTWQSEPGEVERAVKTALQTGYRHIDTASYYDNEVEVGNAIKESVSEGIVKREDVFVVTKLWSTMHRRDDVKLALQESLGKLKLDYLDLFLVHWPIALKKGDSKLPRNEKGFPIFDDVTPLETWKGMEDCVQAGLTRSIGVSNFNSLQISELLAASRVKPAVLQVEVHPFLQQRKLVAFCQQRGVHVTGYSCLGAPQRPWVKAEDKRVLDDPTIAAIATATRRTAAQVVLRWLVQRGVSVIPKSVTPSRIKENFQIFDFELDAAQMKQMESLDRNQRMIIPVAEIDGEMVEIFRGPHYPFDAEF